jgi:hypothetical protein
VTYFLKQLGDVFSLGQLGAPRWLPFFMFFIFTFCCDSIVGFQFFSFTIFISHLFLEQLRDVVLEAAGSRFSWASWVTFFLDQLGGVCLGAVG